MGLVIFLLAAAFFTRAIFTSSAEDLFPTIWQSYSKRGGQVSMRCVVDSRDSDVLVYWNRGSRSTAPFISIGSRLLIDRYNLTCERSIVGLADYYIITISNLTDHDEGNYTCAAQSGRTGSLFTQIFSIQLIESPKINLDAAVESNNVVRVRVHSDSQVGCGAYGRPTPEVSWFRIGIDYDRRDALVSLSGNRATTSASATATATVLPATSPLHLPRQLRVEQNVSILLLHRVNATLHGSKFECLAKNFAGIAVYRIELFVEAPPRLKGSPSVSVHTALGNIESLKCTVEGNPAPDIQWDLWSETTNAFIALMQPPGARKYSQLTRERRALLHEGSLCIFNIQNDDLRLYRCSAIGSLAPHEPIHKVFNVTLAPSVPELALDSGHVFADACNVSWHSVATNVSHYVLEFRPVLSAESVELASASARESESASAFASAPAFQWHSVEIRHHVRGRRRDGYAMSIRPDGFRQRSVRNFTGYYIISRLTPNTSYLVRVAACNAQFCSSFSQSLYFHTKNDVHVAPLWFINFQHFQDASNFAVAQLRLSMAQTGLVLVIVAMTSTLVIPLS